MKKTSLALLLSLVASPAWAGETVELLQSRPGVTQPVLFATPDTPPKAGLILFPGGRGTIGLGDGPTIKTPGNFLVRSRRHFGSDFLIAVIDAPSDRPNGMGDPFRTSLEHARDITVVAQRLRQLGAPSVWLVGTSRGTLSAAWAALTMGDMVDGLVLTSTLTATPTMPTPEAVLSLPLQNLRVPVLVLSHANDACEETPVANTEVIGQKLTASPRVVVKLLSGGDPARSGPCDPFSEHGFLGIEKTAVDVIGAFVLAK